MIYMWWHNIANNITHMNEFLMSIWHQCISVVSILNIFFFLVILSRTAHIYLKSISMKEPLYGLNIELFMLHASLCISKNIIKIDFVIILIFKIHTNILYKNYVNMYIIYELYLHIQLYLHYLHKYNWNNILRNQQ